MLREQMAEDMASQLPIDEPQLRALLLEIPGGVVIAEAPSGKLIYQNAEAVNLLRHPLLHAGNYERYIHGALHQDGRRYGPEEYPIARALAGEIVKEEEILYRRGDGTLGYFLVSATPVRSDGTIVKVLSTFFDISDRRKAEQALKQSEQRLGFALNGADLALWDIDIVSGNAIFDDRLLALLGYRPDEINASFNAWLCLAHTDDKQNMLDRWYDHIEGKTLRYEVVSRFRTACGDWKWISIRGQVIERDKKGDAVRASGTMLDIDRIKRIEIALRESEERFRSTLEHAAIGIATVAPAGRWLSVNPAICATLGYTEQELLHENVRDVMHQADVVQLKKMLDALLENEIAAFTLEQRYLHKDGHTIWADLTISSVCDALGQIRYLVHVIEDKTVRKLAQQQLLKVQTQLQMATQIARVGFWEWDPGSGDIYFSAEWKAQLGYRDDELRNRWDEWETRVHPDDVHRMLDNIDAFLSAPSADFVEECRMRHKDGTYRWISVHGVALFNGDGKLNKLVGTHLDISEQKITQENIRHLAQHDALTGLPNRGLLYEFSEHLVAAARRSSSPLAVLFYDLDRFKTVNDTYGHKVGDGVLREVAQRLNQLMRAEDVIGRLGGDEFIAVLPKIRSKRDASIVAAKALAMLTRPYSIDGIELHLSPSIGISLFPQDGDNIDALIQKADIAMYDVKSSGRNNFRFFAPGLSGRSQHRAGLESRLRMGLEREEFDLYYQPVVDTRTGAVISVEALLRWPQAGQNPIDPAIFIPVAETSGLILPLGEWGLQKICRQHQDWKKQGLPPIPIAVNVSPIQFRSKEFQRSVDRVTTATSIDPAFLEIEVTESTVMQNFDNAVDILQSMKEQGLKISLEDFGAGYSNLARLSRLPLDKLKVDQAFVRPVSSDKSTLAIAEVIVAFGHSLGIDVVMEGIESENDLEFLRQHDCHQAQGFHLGRPMPGYQFAEWYRQRLVH